MSQYGLEPIFRHYINAVLRRAELVFEHGMWLARVHWLQDLHASGTSQAEALNALGDEVANQVFEQMRHGGRVAVIEGIDINGGSC